MPMSAIEMKLKIDSYFNKQDERGKPYTRAGLARNLGMTSKELMKAVETDNEYTSIVMDALTKIEEMAEERLYDKSSSAGSKYVLSNIFGWAEKQEVKQDTKVVVNWDWGPDDNNIEGGTDENKEV